MGLIEGAAQSLYHELTGEDPSMWLAVHELPNVWFGTSTETQPYVDERTPEILAAPGPVRFLSVEPLLGAVDISAYLPPAHNREWCETHGHEYHGDPAECLQCGRVKGEALIDWVIIGHESGQHARHADIAWTRDIVEQCRAAGVACFTKQLGRQAYDSRNRIVLSEQGEPLRTGPWPLRFKHAKGGDPDEWPEDLRVREFPKL